MNICAKCMYELFYHVIIFRRRTHQNGTVAIPVQDEKFKYQPFFFFGSTSIVVQ